MPKQTALRRAYLKMIRIWCRYYSCRSRKRRSIRLYRRVITRITRGPVLILMVLFVQYHREVITCDLCPGPVLILVPLLIAQWSPRNDHTWLASRAIADPRAYSSSHSDHRGMITRDWRPGPVLILVPLPHGTVDITEWSHETGIQGLCGPSAKYFHLTSRGTRDLPVGMRRLPLFLTTKNLSCRSYSNLLQIRGSKSVQRWFEAQIK